MAVSQEIRNITEAIRTTVQVERIYLFGSHAYGAPDDGSDYDIYVVVPDGGLKPLDAAKAAYRSLRQVRRKTPVDIMADYQSSFEQRKSMNTLERKIANEGVVLYERQ